MDPLRLDTKIKRYEKMLPGAPEHTPRVFFTAQFVRCAAELGETYPQLQRERPPAPPAGMDAPAWSEAQGAWREAADLRPVDILMDMPESADMPDVMAPAEGAGE
jgi:hypothetical protein